MSNFELDNSSHIIMASNEKHCDYELIVNEEVVETQVDDGEMHVVVNQSYDYDSRNNFSYGTLVIAMQHDGHGNNNDNDDGSEKKEKVKTVVKKIKKKRSKEDGTETCLPQLKRCKSSSDESYVADLLLSAIEMHIDFSNLTFFSLANILNKEESTFMFAVKMSLINVEPGKCRKCGKKMYLTQITSIKGLHEFRCPRPCRSKLSILENTCFSNCHIDISQILKVIYCWCTGLSHKQASFHCQVGLSTLIDLYKLCRRVCLKMLYHEAVNNKPIGGSGLTVEIGSTSLDKVAKSNSIKNNKKCGKKLRSNKQLRHEEDKLCILTGFCKETKECFVMKIGEQNVETFKTMISTHVSIGSTIVSNIWKGFSTLEGELGKIGYERCVTTSAGKAFHTMIEHTYYAKYPSQNPGLKYETMLKHIANVFPGAFLNGNLKDESSNDDII